MEGKWCDEYSSKSPRNACLPSLSQSKLPPLFELNELYDQERLSRMVREAVVSDASLVALGKEIVQSYGISVCSQEGNVAD
ncbi:hypothetical protein XU18_1896 [Perkinsela sp. CCAP 1560/4]|nr:hypothetical protein XU18_1896 [Perkinsela sp. CCAP 1560/4]|eukprot:KNH07364.1 hypothetical protein XU18_1896 [Perkinsela sp. CCAP 1560/4]